MVAAVEVRGRASTAVRTHFRPRLDRWRWDMSSAVELARQLKGMGSRLTIDYSGGIAEHAKGRSGAGLSNTRPVAEQIMTGSQHMTGAVGMITSPIR